MKLILILFAISILIQSGIIERHRRSMDSLNETLKDINSSLGNSRNKE